MPLRLVHLEDDAHDAELVRETLIGDGADYLITPACDRQSFLAAIQDAPDLVLADFSLPTFDGLTAQTLLRERWPDVPFVFVSGSLGEERAIETLRAGATDYVLKHRLRPLSQVVQRALAEVEQRRGRRRAEEELKALNAELEQRVRERTRQLEEAYAAIAGREEDLRRSEQFLASVVEHVPDVMFVKDATTLRYVRLNRSLETIFGKPTSEIVGRSDADLFPPAQAEALALRDRAALRSNGVDVREESIHTHDQGWRTLHTKRVPISDAAGNALYLLGIARDVTERRVADHALKEARTAADRANRAKSEFLSRMSHELRTPLNAVLGFAQLFELDALTPRQAENIQHIVEGGQHLLDLINEVLDISRIEAGHLLISPEPLAVQDVVGEVAAMIRPLAERQQVTLHVPDAEPSPTYALADRQRLKQVLLNLCSNAVKYNRPGGEIYVTYSSSEGHVCIAVRDSGVGIPETKHSLLFTPFERLGADRTSVEGTGLGLALSKRLVDLMQGTLSVQSKLGEGSTFSVRLPAADRPAVPILAAAPTVRPLAKASSGMLLYIEDTIANAQLVERVIEQRPGVRLLHALDGRTGLEVIEQQRPPLVLLDLHLPDMSGEEVLDRIRRQPTGQAIHVAILTADATTAQQERLLARGANAYLTKPLNIREVLRLVDQVLGGVNAGAGM
jgi:PAS domain S-box-containing protein